MKQTKLQRCRELFCEYLNEFSGAPNRKEIMRRFRNKADVSKTCSATYYQTIKKEMQL